HRLVVRVRVKYASDIQFKIDWIDRPLQNNAVAQLPSVLLRKGIVADHTLTVALPSGDLIRGHFKIAESLEEFIWISAELCEKVRGFLVFINPAEPRNRDHRHDPRDCPYLFPVEAGQREGERDAVPDHQPLGRFGAALIEIESPPNGHHQGQQEQGESDAQYRQDAA